MNVWEDRKSKDAKLRKIYSEMRDCMRKIKDQIDSEETLESYISLLIRFIRGRSSLMDVDHFASKILPQAVKADHEKLFTHLLDGAQVPIGKKAMEDADRKREQAIPTESFITVYLFLMGARHGFEEMPPESGELIVEAIKFHVKGIIEDAVKVRLPYLVSPSGSLRLNTTT
ncbi:hypothetical protein PENTCL1PPCAC_25808, partial [Pristionchus entomophagus]